MSNDGAQAAPTAEGTFVKTPLSNLLIYVLEHRLTGSLELTSAHAPVGTVLFTQGFPAKAMIADDIHHLGEIMADLGLVTAEQLALSRERMQESPRLQGQILIELGFVTPEVVDAGLRAQLERKLEHLLALPSDTNFAYYDGVDNLARFGGGPTAIDPLPVLWRGVRNTPPWEHIDATLRRLGTHAVHVPTGAKLDRFHFTRAEQSAIELLQQGPMRVTDLAVTKGVGPSLAQLLVYCLVIAKQVEFVDVTPPHAASVAAPSAGGPPAAAAAPPHPLTTTGLAFARVQLQAKPVTRAPLVVEETSVPCSPNDGRVSSPGLTLPSAVPTPPSSTSPSAEQNAVEQKILDRAASISSQDFFQMLGVARDAPAEVVQNAYIALAKVWHPDRLPPALASVRDACTKVFAYITEAHATLTDGERRAKYMTLIREGGATPDDQARIQAILEAATDFQKAEIHFKRSDMQQAYDLAKKAHLADPEQVDYLAMVTWIEAQSPECSSRAKT
ncbi:MAG: J domain-containing protein, partial [Polyangiaceae bacterium]|nr:J domain-containing protein [Polyangiaceae bacterium]